MKRHAQTIAVHRNVPYLSADDGSDKHKLDNYIHDFTSLGERNKLNYVIEIMVWLVHDTCTLSHGPLFFAPVIASIHTSQIRLSLCFSSFEDWKMPSTLTGVA